MFYYFGYGSNLSVISLRAKGVEPLASEPAILGGWRLVFDIPDFFEIEGGTGNIRPQRGHSVHGVVHACRDADLDALDKLEALGVTYDRIETSITTYGGRSLRAYVYVGLPDCVGEEQRPSQRYRNILLNGATNMGLQPGYVEQLRDIPARPLTPPSPFAVSEELPSFSLEMLSSKPDHVGLNGAVFDMTEAPPRHAYLRALLGGHDASLLFLRRMDTSTGDESTRDIRTGNLDEAQTQYLDAYAHEFTRVYKLVGKLDYGVFPSSIPAPPGSQWSRTERPQPPGERSWRPNSLPAQPLRLASSVPAARVLRMANDHFASAGHENLGFLSETWGFMPRQQPLQSLGKSHAAWDQVAGDLTEMYRTLRVRERIEELPVLPADAENLSEQELLRAAAIMGILAHAYWYSRKSPPKALPDAIAKPWATLRERLGRGPAVLSYIDLIVYNWRLVDETLADPLRLNNMRLLLPTVDNDSERTFYLTQTEILARCSPVVAASVRAQAAAQVDDREAVEAELMTIIACLQRVIRESLLNINPNPSGDTYVDPVVWAKTVAPFAVPFVDGVLGPSGTSSPIFNLLDIFLGRKKFESFLGTEIRNLRETYPPHWQEFLKELSKVNVGQYIAETEDPNLMGLWRETLETYVGDQGFLGRHRMKVYGYLELAFKVGRSVTIGGFSGLFDDRTWDQVDGELEQSRAERVALLPRACHHVRIKEVQSDGEATPSGVAHVVLDVTGTGIHYEAGDRCGVLPENSPELVQRTVDALGTTPDHRVQLTPEWRDVVSLRYGYEDRTELSLEELLRFGRIRPILPRVAEALHAMSQDPLLKERIRRQQTHVWELWDLLLHLRRGGFDPSPLLEGDALAKVLAPESFRTYSISSVMSRASMAEASEIRLTVGQIAYRTEGLEGVAEVERRGTASSFLDRAAGRDEPVSIVLNHPPRFGLPQDPTTPIVLIAGGTGLSPFRGFLIERSRLRDAGPAFVFLGLRSREYFAPYEEELSRAVAEGRTAVQVAFSRDDVESVYDQKSKSFIHRPASRRYVQDVMLQERTARELWALLQPTHESESGAPAHVFICGRSRFAYSALEAFREIFRRFAEGTDEERDAAASDTLTRLLGEGRMKLEIFSGDAPQGEAAQPINLSDILLRNDETHGYWFIIDSVVYDVTEFVRNHPGGAHVLRGYSGLDATQGYERSHSGRSEIQAMLEMYQIGTVRLLDLGTEALEAQSDSGPTTTSLSAMHGAVVRFAHLVVEMENALRNDQSIQDSVTTRDDPVRPRSPYKLERALETHERFVASYLEAVCGTHAPRLWDRFQAVIGDEPGWMSQRLAAISRSNLGGFERGLRAALNEAIAAGEYERSGVALKRLQELDRSFLGEVKSLLRDTLRIFERLESRTLMLGADQLTSSLRRVASAVSRYYELVATDLGAMGWEVGLAVEEEDVAAPPPATEVLLATPLWELKVDRTRGFVQVRRTPVAVDNIEEMLSQNELVIAHMTPDHASMGIVVDMRQAPARNDPEFENAMRRFRGAVDEHYRRVAVLLESSVGVLQVNRLSRNEGAKHFATRSENSAIKYAMGTG